MKTIFVVEDDIAICELIAYALRGAGYDVRSFADGEKLLYEVQKAQPDLMILDIMLPGTDGLTLLRRLREQGNRLPVILLTAKSSEYDKVTGLDAGADDYVAKPFGVMELLSRVRAVLRRTGHAQAQGVLTLGTLRMDTLRYIVRQDTQELTLTRKEFELLRFLLEHKGQALTRDQILSAVWGYGFEGETRTVDVHIGTLRQKLGDFGGQIETVRGIGYRMEENL